MRRAFTLPELLIVTVITAILMSLLLTGIASVRWTAADIECANQMRNISILCQAYKSNHGVFPQPTADPMDGNWITTLGMDASYVTCPFETIPDVTDYLAILGKDYPIPDGHWYTCLGGGDVPLIGERMATEKYGAMEGGFYDTSMWIDGNPIAKDAASFHSAHTQRWVWPDGSVR